MFKDVHIIPHINGAVLDNYLSHGWYRMRQIIFTTDYLQRDEKMLRVIWLRYRLSDFRFSNKQQKLLELPAGWSMEINPFVRTEEQETVYAAYRNAIDFEISQTLEDSLFGLKIIGGESDPVFDSYSIELHQGNKLMATGIFDKGDRSIMGIINYYDPACRRISPGKKLILYKLQYALNQGMDYYYPGYIVPELPKFNYKLEAGEYCCELYDPENDCWLPYEALDELMKNPPPVTV